MRIRLDPKDYPYAQPDGDHLVLPRYEITGMTCYDIWECIKCHNTWPYGGNGASIPCSFNDYGAYI